MLSRKSHIALIPTFALLLLVAAGLASATWASDQEGPDFEPAISANGLFLVGYTKLEDPDGAPTSRTGLFAQQVELHMAAHVDTDLVGEISLLLPRGSRTVDQVEIGETFVIARLSPVLELKAGQFYADFGRHNALHPHEFPFLDQPLVLERLFGVDGINEVGLGLRRSLPTPWDASISIQLLSGDNLRWGSRTDEDLLHTVYVENVWRREGGTSVELGGSWAGGANIDERFTHALGVDLNVEWPRGESEELGLRWQTEYALTSEDLRAGRRNTGGFSSSMQYRFARRWWAQGRYDYYGLPREEGEGWEDRISVLFAFVPNRRAPLRLQYSRWRVDGLGRGFNQYHIQLNFTIGPHQAHRYSH
jgi:hypothetical protein